MTITPSSMPVAAPLLLLVEDDREFLELLERRFARRQITLVACSTASDALSAVRAHSSLAAAVIDRRLAGEDGILLVTELRQQAPHLQCIMLSGQADSASVEHARSHGVTEYLAKPCGLAELEEAVRKALAGRQVAS